MGENNNPKANHVDADLTAAAASATTTATSKDPPSPCSPINVPLLTKHNKPSWWKVFSSATKEYVIDDHSSCYSFLMFLTFATIFIETTMLLGVFYRNQPQTSIVSLSLYSLNISASNQLNGEWKIEFSILNPSKTELSYDFAEVSVYYRDEVVAENILGEFHAKGQTETVLKADIVAKNRSVGKYMAMDILRVLEEQEEGLLVFDVKLLACQSGRNRLYYVNTCKDVGVRFWKHGMEGALADDFSPCRLIYDWE